jgi:anti-anti-sigma factor
MSAAQRSWLPRSEALARSAVGDVLLRLELQDLVCANRHTLVLTGEVDIASVWALDAALARICTSGTDAVVLDLRGVTFMDSSGIHAILRAEQLCRELQGCWFALIPDNKGQVRRVLELTGLLGHSFSGAAANTHALTRQGATPSGAAPGRLAARGPLPRREPDIPPATSTPLAP